MTSNINFGFPEEHTPFLDRNPGIQLLYEKVNLLAAAIYSNDKTYTLKPSGLVAFGLLTAAHEVFLEIFVLASNGFGHGAQARLRTLYELVSVAAFVGTDHDKAEKFIKR